MADICLLRVVGKSNLPVPQDGLQKTESIWRDKYTGTAEKLVAAGIAEAHQFPGQPGRGKTMASYRPDGTPVGRGSTDWHNEPGHMSIKRAGMTKFVVSVRVAEGDGKRRHAMWLTERNGDQRARDAQERQEGMTEELARMPKTADEFRRQLVRHMRNEYGPIGMLRSSAVGDPIVGESGFRLDAKALRAFDALCARLLAIAINGGIELNIQRQESLIAEIKRRAVADGAPEQKPPPRHLVLASFRP